MTFITSFENCINKLVKSIGALCAVLLIMLVFVLAFNAIARYGFSFISIGLEELTWHLNAAIFMLGMAYALHTGNHVRVDLIFQKLTLRQQAWVDIIGSLLFLLPFCGLLIYYGWDYMNQSYITHERSEHPTGLPYRFIVKGLVFFSSSLLCLASVSFVIHKVKLLLGLAQANDMDQVVH